MGTKGAIEGMMASHSLYSQHFRLQRFHSWRISFVIDNGRVLESMRVLDNGYAYSTLPI